MDKQLIDSAHEIWAAAQLAQGEGIEDGADRVAAILARIDAERGKEAVAWASWIDDDSECLPKDARLCSYEPLAYKNRSPLFLSPTIPEGMALVPIEPTEAMELAGLEASYNALLGCCTANHLRIYRAMLAAAQGERNGN